MKHIENDFHNALYMNDIGFFVHAENNCTTKYSYDLNNLNALFNNNLIFLNSN